MLMSLGSTPCSSQPHTSHQRPEGCQSRYLQPAQLENLVSRIVAPGSRRSGLPSGRAGPAQGLSGPGVGQEFSATASQWPGVCSSHLVTRVLP